MSWCRSSCDRSAVELQSNGDRIAVVSTSNRSCNNLLRYSCSVSIVLCDTAMWFISYTAIIVKRSYGQNLLRSSSPLVLTREQTSVSSRHSKWTDNAAVTTTIRLRFEFVRPRNSIAQPVMGVVAAAVSEISIRDEAECWITWSERQDIVDAKSRPA